MPGHDDARRPSFPFPLFTVTPLRIMPHIFDQAFFPITASLSEESIIGGVLSFIVIAAVIIVMLMALMAYRLKRYRLYNFLPVLLLPISLGSRTLVQSPVVSRWGSF